MIASGFHLPWWIELLLTVVLTAQYWIPVLIAALGLRWWLRRRK